MEFIFGDTSKELDFIYSRYHNPLLIMDMEALEANKLIKAGQKAIWEERCWLKWLSENGAEMNYVDYEKKFFGLNKPPSLDRAYKLARELKRREESQK